LDEVNFFKNTLSPKDLQQKHISAGPWLDCALRSDNGQGRPLTDNEANEATPRVTHPSPSETGASADQAF